MKLLGVSGSPSVASKTLTAVALAVEHARASYPDVSAEVLNLRDHDVQFSDGRDPATYEGDTRTVIDTVLAADALVVGTPMYRGGYTGRLKNLFDVLPNDALEGKPVGLVATGGTDHHFLAIEHELKPVVGFFPPGPSPARCTRTTASSPGATWSTRACGTASASSPRRSSSSRAGCRGRSTARTGRRSRAGR